MFALVVTGGVVITKLDDGQREREALTKIHPWEQFKAHRTIKKWAHLILAADELEGVIPFIKQSYYSALDESKKS